MKAMKKILFLALVLAFALTAVAFAETESTVITLTQSQIVEMIEGKKTCPECETGTVNVQFTVQEWSCDRPFTVEINCLNPECALGKTKVTTTIENLGHKPTTIVGDYTDATCVKPGVAVEETYCERCGKTLETVELHNQLAQHLLMSDILYNVVGKTAAELDNASAKQAYDYFKKVQNDYLNDVDKTAHEYYKYDIKHDTVEFKAATCTEDGYLKVTCDLCGVFFNEKLEKLGHNLDNQNALEIFPTCETDGAVVRFCLNAGCDHYEVEVTDPRLGHDYSVKPEASESPAPQYYWVQNGKEIYNFSEVVECEPYDVKQFCNHYFEEIPVSDPVVPGDMTEEEMLALLQKILGEDLELFYVDKCLFYMCQDSKFVEKNVVTYTHDDFTNPTKYADLLAKGYIREIYTNAATCTEQYEHKFMCTECREVITWTDDALGHKWAERGEVITPATCEEQGVTKVKCERCNETTEIKTPAAGHKVNVYYDPIPSCTTPGNRIEKCVVCQKVVKNEKVDAYHPIGNEFYAKDCTQVKVDEYVNAAGETIAIYEWVANTCEVDGLLKYECAVCKTPIEKTIKAPKHNFDFENIFDPDNTLWGVPANQMPWWVKEVIEPTCQNEGSITVWCKNDCGKTSTLKTSDKLDHKYVEVVPNVRYIEPTCTSEGKGVGECVWCGRKADITIAKIPHTPILNADQTLSCKFCDYTEKFDYEIEYKVNLINAKITATSTSGVGKIELIEGKPHVDEPLYARINFGYTLDNGEPVAYVACVEIDKDGEFRMASPTCPYGATLTNIAVVITTASDAQDLVIADVPNLGMTIVR